MLMAAGLCAACATVDRPQMSDFAPTADGGFRFTARADLVFYREDSASAEAERIRWLETWLADNGLCRAGYEITSRRPVVRSDILGRVFDIHYTGRCRS